MIPIVNIVAMLSLGGPPECGNGSPAFPIPASRLGVGLWSDALRPADPVDAPLPANRDSTDYLSTTIPSQASGHELFYAVDGVGPLAVVAYNVGLQLWRIEDDGTMVLASAADGIAGDFLFHPPSSETDGFVRDVAIAELPGVPDEAVVVLGALTNVGLGVWHVNTTTGSLVHAYQDSNPDGSISVADVEIIDAGDRLLSVSAALADGIVVHDVSAALAYASLRPPGCLSASGGCSEVRLGSLTGGYARYVTAANTNGGMVVVVANGAPGLNLPPLRLLRVDDLADPTTAVVTFTEPDASGGPVVFGGVAPDRYLAVARADMLELYDAEPCLARGECESLGPLLATAPLPINGAQGSNAVLTPSRLDDGDLLHFAEIANGGPGPGGEALWDLRLRGRGIIDDLARRGGAYDDPCTGESGIAYFADTYANNDFGLRNVWPQQARIVGGRLIRAANGVLDQHIVTLPAPSPDDDSGGDSTSTDDAGGGIDDTGGTQGSAGLGEADGSSGAASTQGTESAVADDGPSSGCGCATIAGAPGFAWVLVVLGGARWRRRRSSTAFSRTSPTCSG
jgi:MYXO-CTERM domain-containing protein